MDNGEEIPALNESWTLLGAKVSEWISGATMGILVLVVSEEVFGIKGASVMPLLLVVGVTTTVALASLRIKYLDEERGIMFRFLDAVGFPPPIIPRPASQQPEWSGCRSSGPKEKSYFVQLKLEEIVNLPDEKEDNSSLKR